MAIFGGFMTIVSILGFFLTVIWFVLPFVIFSIKGRVDRSSDVLEDMNRRLAALEEHVRRMEAAKTDLPPTCESRTAVYQPVEAAEEEVKKPELT